MLVSNDILNTSHSHCNKVTLLTGTGIMEMSRKAIYRESEGLAATVSTGPSLDNIRLSQLQAAGIAILQNLPSVVACHVLGARPGTRVLDMCAAPGGQFQSLVNTFVDFILN